MGFNTRQIHAGVEPDPVTGSILTPIYQTTTYVQESVDEYLSKGYSYSRSGNPTVRALEKKLAVLEGGADCTCYGTGMAAIQARATSRFLNAGDHVHRLRRRLRRHLPASARRSSAASASSFTFVDTSKPEAVRPSAAGRTRG